VRMRRRCSGAGADCHGGAAVTAQEHIERIKSALEAWEKAHGIVATTETWGAVAKACNPAAMSSVLAHIDAQAAEIESLKIGYANLLVKFEKMVPVCEDCQGSEEKHDLLEAIRTHLAHTEACKWTFDDEESNTWASGCGELWSFIDGGPAENRVKYCHGCGKPVEIGVPAP
jgi:hypothetical protein